MRGFRGALARVAVKVERFVDRLRPARSKDSVVIEPYLGYATPGGIVARGRVLTSLRRTVPAPEQSRLVNLLQMTRLFLTSEVAGVTVVAESDGGAPAIAVSDEEGYFTLRLARTTGSGWIDVPVRTLSGSTARLPVLVVPGTATLGIISDVDDTILKTGAYSLARNLWTTFTGSALTRHVFPDAVALVRRLHAGRNPVFYVSSSPWNLHHFLQDIFGRAGMVRGPMFLRDLGIGEDKFVTRSHGDHKGSAIDTILAANPGLRFVLIGDTGQHDAEVYARAAERHPGRIRRVILRTTGPGADEDDTGFARALARMGVAVSIGRDYRSLVRVRPGSGAAPPEITP